MTVETESPYVTSSNVGLYYRKHIEAMQLCKDQPEGISFAIMKKQLQADETFIEFSLNMLKEQANRYCVGNKSYVVVEWPDRFEIQRLPNGASAKSFYNHIASDSKEGADVICELTYANEVKRVAKEYLLSSEVALTYDPSLTKEMLAQKIVSYAYFQRRLAPTSLFRKDKTKLKSTLEELTKVKYLTELPKSVAKGQFNRTAKLYQIVGETE